MDDLVFNTAFGQLRVFETEDDAGAAVRVMWVGGAFQSATYLDERCNELVFEYYRAFDHMFDAGIPVGRALMIGGGGYAYPKHFLHEHPQAAMDVVEADPLVNDIAYDWFYLDRLMADSEAGLAGELGLICDEGLAFLRESDDVYDCIINDCFAGKDADASLATPEALELVRERLVAGGLYLVNVVVNAAAGEYGELFELVRRLQGCFAQVYIIDASDDEFSDAENYLVIATDGEYTFEGVIPYDGVL